MIFLVTIHFVQFEKSGTDFYGVLFSKYGAILQTKLTNLWLKSESRFELLLSFYQVLAALNRQIFNSRLDRPLKPGMQDKMLRRFEDFR